MSFIKDPWLEKLYREAFPPVARIVARLGGGPEEAKDIFHDALVIYLEKKYNNRLSVAVSDKAYLAGIARICWIRKFNQGHREMPFEPGDRRFDIPEDYYELEKSTSHSLLDKLKLAGEKCLQLLRAFYYDQQSMQEIAEKFHYRTRHSATVQKHKCIEKLREEFKKTEQYEEIIA